ncbi:NADP-dependent glyceraldehyde-3-phosphate dehydrogenase [Salibacterium salarium]|uniref:NADP-dependent glyceraldehyde-3-phosphate dehydrogenase n=1 Tax=Salibacterium salarium TaxID=284579 RepID=A0A428N5V1_9BACI|nr:NADP-dependent glyceraldehyde-3-phosphate dehydrogenase [Salibacterium salarium]RSL33860.1 NADP-dependent glyceraldehyde-3-phosphate dehydrogenase [Salibacterium salarium]
MLTHNVETFSQKNVLLQGEWRENKNGNRITLASPSNGEEIGSVPALSEEEVNEAVEASNAAQKEWAKTPLHERKQLLHRWADNLVEHKEAIGTMIMQEVAKKKSSAIDEVVRTADFIRHTAEEGVRLNGELLSGDSYNGGAASKTAQVNRVPLGVVLAISPFNYPLNLSASKIAPALMTGNGVVFKPATQGALSGIMMIEALEQAGLPEGLVNITTGRGSEIGDALVTHKGIDQISFTGGSETGISMSKKVGMVPLVLELGGKDPAIVLEDADLDKAAKEITGGAFSYSGQRCTAIKRVLVKEEAADELVAKLKEKVEALSVGLPEDDADITPLINDKTADNVQSLIDDAIEKKAEVVTGDEKKENLLSPTLLDHVSTDARVAWEEPFGPVLPVLRVKSEEEAVQIANESEYGLQASVFTQDIDAAHRIADQLDVGSVQLNGKTSRGPDHFPFLGVKNSGLGVQGVRYSLLSLSREKVKVLNG